jgi:hypothetical protein
MIDVRFVPLKTWPATPTLTPKPSPFKADWLRTLDLLERELTFLRARDVLIQGFFARDQIRNDGWPKVGAATRSPGIVLSFQSKGLPLAFPCDRYDEWQANLRAIALALEALRAVDRYGVTRTAEQYRGWAQIAPPSAFPTKEAAAEFLANASGSVVSVFSVLHDSALRQQVYRTAAARLHPDQATGSHELFVRLQQAMELLGK